MKRRLKLEIQFRAIRIQNVHVQSALTFRNQWVHVERESGMSTVGDLMAYIKHQLILCQLQQSAQVVACDISCSLRHVFVSSEDPICVLGKKDPIR